MSQLQVLSYENLDELFLLLLWAHVFGAICPFALLCLILHRCPYWLIDEMHLAWEILPAPGEEMLLGWQLLALMDLSFE